MGKHKGKDDEEDPCEETGVKPDDGLSYEELVQLVGPIASPLASKKLTKRLLKIVKKSGKARLLKRGVREVVKSIRKDITGIVVFAGDVSPIDVISHIPVFCEEKKIPYCYVPSRRELGSAGGTKRPTSVVLVQPNKDYDELYQKCFKDVSSLPLPIV